jgi:hypothetical protein
VQFARDCGATCSLRSSRLRLILLLTLYHSKARPIEALASRIFGMASAKSQRQCNEPCNKEIMHSPVRAQLETIDTHRSQWLNLRLILNRLCHKSIFSQRSLLMFFDSLRNWPVHSFAGLRYLDFGSFAGPAAVHQDLPRRDWIVSIQREVFPYG